MDPLILKQLAPRGVLRAGLNLANTLLVGAPDEQSNLTGIGPNLARLIALELGVPYTCVPFASPRQLADAAGRDIWDICLMGMEPARAQTIAFTPPYLEIDATFLVHAGSYCSTVQELDEPGTRIAAAIGSAYELWLTRHFKRAHLVCASTHEEAYEAFDKGHVNALAGLRPRLLIDQKTLDGARLLDGCFTSVQQAIGTHRRHEAAAAFLKDIVEQAKALGLIDDLITLHQVNGVRTAPLLQSVGC
jgi:polar amino acid transport system substrate-binding protein